MRGWLKVLVCWDGSVAGAKQYQSTPVPGECKMPLTAQQGWPTGSFPRLGSHATGHSSLPSEILTSLTIVTPVRKMVCPLSRLGMHM